MNRWMLLCVGVLVLFFMNFGSAYYNYPDYSTGYSYISSRGYGLGSNVQTRMATYDRYAAGGWITDGYATRTTYINRIREMPYYNYGYDNGYYINEIREMPYYNYGYDNGYGIYYGGRYQRYQKYWDSPSYNSYNSPSYSNYYSYRPYW